MWEISFPAKGIGYPRLPSQLYFQSVAQHRNGATNTSTFPGLYLHICSPQWVAR